MRRPAMSELEFPVTRLRVIEDDDGWLKLVCSLAPMLKLFQLITALWVVWLMSRRVAEVSWIVAVPSTTVPPWGLAWASCGSIGPIDRRNASEVAPSAGMNSRLMPASTRLNLVVDPLAAR